jgi:hypothetical protein
MVLVDVSHERILHGLRRDGLNLRDEIVIELISEVLRVDKDNALIRYANSRVAAGSRNHVDAGLDLLDRLGRRLSATAAPSLLPTLSALRALATSRTLSALLSAGRSALAVATASTASASAATASTALAVSGLLSLGSLSGRRKRHRRECKNQSYNNNQPFLLHYLDPP